MVQLTPRLLIGYEKRDHITHHVIFCFSSKTIKAPGFLLGLSAVCAFYMYFTDPMLEARASLLYQSVSKA